MNVIDPVTPSTAPGWHTLSSAAVAQQLGVDPQIGLEHQEAQGRATVHGPNALQEQVQRGLWRMLLDQFTDVMILVLLAAALLAGLIGEPKDSVTIAIIVLLNGIIGFIQEYRAEQAMAALKQLAAPGATVRRDGQVYTLPAVQVVPGDVVLLEAGDIVPADLRLLEAVQLTLEEAALTGESVPVHKHVAPLATTTLPLGDRLNMAYKATTVTNGHGSGVVVATGMHTELGKIATLLHMAEDTQTPLQKRLTVFGQRLALAALAICAVVFGTGVLRGEPVVLMLLTAVSLAVAAIPEALPAVITLSLALGARHMARQQALMRRLPAVETLGSVTYICTDKTGTLTQNRMRVEQVEVDGMPPPEETDGTTVTHPARLLYQAMALSNDVVPNAPEGVRGDPTEVALYQAALQAGYDKSALALALPRLADLPFDAERKRMTTLHQSAMGVLTFTKGAPEAVLAQCTAVLQGEDATTMDTTRLLQHAAHMAAHGLRVLAFAYRVWPALPTDLTVSTVETQLTLLGLVGLLDPPRAEALEAVALCRSAGITPVMITGDHPATAQAIARRLGIIRDGDNVMTGEQLSQLAPQALVECVAQTYVYARVTPEHKLNLVQALQTRGEFVAMTGDGVNDAPALKRADIGIAMGRTGTDVAREAAHMILLDDNFATIVAAVRAGRRIFDNIRKFIKYTMTSNAGEIWTIFLAPFLGLPIPLLPIHILWINLVTDGLPGLALAAEPEEPGLMQRPPRPPRESIFAHGLWQHIIWVGLLMGGVSLGTQAWASHVGSPAWQTMVFTTLTLSQMGHVLAIRSERVSLFSQGLGSNMPLLGAVALTFVLQMATIYLPWLQPIFKTVALRPEEWLFCLGASSIVCMAVEGEKWLRRHGWLYT